MGYFALSELLRSWSIRERVIPLRGVLLIETDPAFACRRILALEAEQCIDLVHGAQESSLLDATPDWSAMKSAVRSLYSPPSRTVSVPIQIFDEDATWWRTIGRKISSTESRW